MANLIYASIRGKKQGLISAGCGTFESIGNKYQSTHSDEIFVLQLEHSLSRIDNTIPHPIKFFKPIDKSSPLLGVAISENEELSLVFNFYRTCKGGGVELFYTVTVNGAHISNISSCYPHVLNHAGNQPEEVITIAYKDITWKHHGAGTEGYSLWEDRLF